MKLQRRISRAERAAQGRRLARLKIHWGRPSAETSEAVWELLSPSLGVCASDLSLDETTAKQALVVVLDCALLAGRNGSMFTVNAAFDALATRWSPTFRRALDQGPARCSYDMRPRTVRTARRDLMIAGIRMQGLWETARSKKNPLYVAHRIPKQGYQIRLSEASEIYSRFDRLVAEDSGYRRPITGVRVLLRDERTPDRALRQDVAGEQPYNVVKLGSRSEQLLDFMEQSQLYLDLENFRDEYDRASQNAQMIARRVKKLYGIDASLSSAWPKRYYTGKDKKRRRVASPRQKAVWEHVPKGLHRVAVRRLLAAYDRARGIVTQFEGVRVCLRGLKPSALVMERERTYVPIRSGFFRAHNRRFHATHFWPEQVSGNLDQAEHIAEKLLTIRTSPRGRWFEFVTHIDDPAALDHDGTGNLIGVDVSSSQTQVLASFLGIPQLEAIAGGKKPFKEFLAEQAWPLLRDRYPEPSNKKLVELVKSLWLRVLYGSSVRTVILDQDHDWATYGEGWIAGQPDQAAYARALDEAEAVTQGFLASIPGFAEVSRFLQACQRIAQEVDTYEGFTFTDPFDNAKVVWNPPRRRLTRVRWGDQIVYVFAPTGDPKDGKYPIDRAELSTMIAPCLTHALDACYSALVMEGLRDAGVRDFVALHDSWLAPVEFAAIRSQAARAWFQGLGPVYDRLIHYLRGTKFQPDALDWKTQWRQRLRDQAWPDFAVKWDPAVDYSSIVPPLIRSLARRLRRRAQR